ncbi:riboflavin synthase [Cytobacillus purgationiresistens]|uniref:Riboflavin synthase n=1 Tax=Cytobacillus purgationiresistens TaxID=863449 RepID=A0ABU0AI72_9BACI|nr:riboflavin synthase [Cytobacillus purgationiresistens]MDQ0270487.1 riboflavin synthase [Cytobacillus purgationiresistens]
MFTGIIEELGTVKRAVHQGNTIELTIASSKVLTDVKEGDSIAVNGVCLTVTHFNHAEFTADVMPETYLSTSLSKIKPQSKVNLERAMPANGRFGGHFVSGHVDAVGTILRKIVKENAVYFDISIPTEYRYLLLDKGSVAIDGTSLTVMALDDDKITVSLIPHTRNQSVLGEKKIGDQVNLEFDMLAKYIDSMVNKKPKQKNADLEILLKDNGFYS